MVEANRIIEKRIKSSALYRDLQSILGLMCQTLATMTETAENDMREDLPLMLLSGGKRLRPILAYVCYRMGGSKKKEIRPLMCMLELMHSASLIHDDVVDAADKRRGKPTINNIRGDLAAVQSGDFLLAKAMELLHIYKGMGINEKLADVSYNMTIGELKQQSIRYKFDKQSIGVYFDLIHKKTAMLLAASCWCGAVAGGMSREDALSLYSYGEKLGIAFQLRDDMIDYSDDSGKAPGQDLRNGMFTLPVLTLLERGAPGPVVDLLMKQGKTDDEVQRLMDHVKESGTLKRVEAMVVEKSEEAIDELKRFSPGPEKKALSDLVLSLAEHQF